jgi:hypothetical protein
MDEASVGVRRSNPLSPDEGDHVASRFSSCIVPSDGATESRHAIRRNPLPPQAAKDCNPKPTLERKTESLD